MKWFFPFIPGIFWVIICTILLTMPGSSFPKEDWLDKIWFDKWVHIGLFAVMVVLWCRGIKKGTQSKQKLPGLFRLVMLLAIAYGTGMEFMQKYAVVNRSFDGADIVADAAGAVLGYWFSRRVYIKKLTPVETGVATKTNCL